MEWNWKNSPWKYEYKSEDAPNLNNGRCVLSSSAAKYFSNGLESLGHWETLNCPVKNTFLNDYQLQAAAAKCSEQRKKIKDSHRRKCAFLLVPSVKCWGWWMMCVRDDLWTRSDTVRLLSNSSLHVWMWICLEKRRSRRHSITKRSLEVEHALIFNQYRKRWRVEELDVQYSGFWCHLKAFNVVMMLCFLRRHQLENVLPGM